MHSSHHEISQNTKGKHNYYLLSILCFIQLMITFDATIVSIALPDAQAALQLSDSDRDWIITLYTLAFGTILPLGGRIGDIYGYKKVLITGMTGFLLAAILGGVSTNFIMLAISRAGQGIFAAILAPSVLALISLSFTDNATRSKAFAAYGSVSGAGGGIGLIISGLLTQFLNWRWCFFAIAICAAIALISVISSINPYQIRNNAALDVMGTILISLAIFLFIAGISLIDGTSINLAVLGLFIVSAIVLITFIRRESRVQNPIIPLKIFHDKFRTAAFIAMFLLGFGNVGVFILTVYYFRQILHYSPLTTAWAFLSFIIPLLICNNLSSKIFIPRLGKRITSILGFSMGIMGLAFLGAFVQVDSTFISTILPSLILMGCGFGITGIALIRSSLDGLQADTTGSASAVVNSMQQIGSSVGSTVTGIISIITARFYLDQHYDQRYSVNLSHITAESQVFSFSMALFATAAVFIIGALISLGFIHNDKGNYETGNPCTESRVTAIARK